MIDAILVPRGSEARAVRAGLADARKEIAVVEMGVGPRAASLAAQTLLSSSSARPERVLVAGLAGLLSPSLAVGDALVYSSILRDNGSTVSLVLDRALASTAAAAIPRALDGIVAVESATIVTRAAAKRELAERTHAAAVDMESFAVAETLADFGIATAVVRVGSDALDDDLPTIDRALDGSGGIDGFALFLAMIREPLLGASMARNGVFALGRLRGVVRSLLR